MAALSAARPGSCCRKGIVHADIKLPDSIRSRALGAIAKTQTVPQLFVNGTLVSDSDAIEHWVEQRQA